MWGFRDHGAAAATPLSPSLSLSPLSHTAQASRPKPVTTPKVDIIYSAHIFCSFKSTYSGDGYTFAISREENSVTLGGKGSKTVSVKIFCHWCTLEWLGSKI
ncbi:hypothetical protein KC19_6G122600 [Ceratodon purpureus]|uniref:Uncharacterized protein n=1 Tax=Ceratodon purpureus TaxID=3225 RepID=A0A8T0HE85_CERPU|nr:hypothetical protein KC19_6G122600 [Ceratodon purpureus]